MSYFLRSGDTYRVAANNAIDLRTELPANNFIIKKCSQTGELYLEEIGAFKIPSKLYGSTKNKAQRIIRTYRERSTNTGILLVGEKGSGKSLLAKVICEDAEIPVIVVNNNYSGDTFCKLLQNIEQECVVLFDEFEKTYKRFENGEGEVSTQEEILTLLDGVYCSKKLFIFTSNSKWGIDEHMRNRPGRIYYFLEFEGIEESLAKEYCEENLKNKEWLPRIHNVMQAFPRLNFDMLQALVEETNRYNEDPVELLQLLNIKPEFEANTDYVPELLLNNKPITREGGTWSGNPFHERLSVGDRDGRWHEFSRGHLKEIDHSAGIITYEKESGYKLILRKAKNNKFSIPELFAA